jgi:hypothetical protein
MELSHPIAGSTVWQILHAAGIDPAPHRTDPTWKQFLIAWARGILAVEFVHVDTALHSAQLRPDCHKVPHPPRSPGPPYLEPRRAWTTQAALNSLLHMGQRAASVNFVTCYQLTSLPAPSTPISRRKASELTQAKPRTGIRLQDGNSACLCR